ncbi:MAG: biotin synthase BioB [Candidatus Omnitrophica bacterium]|nr:biotin synthase BioB [Candidatus Omnitrophota bacterium]
MGNFNLDSFLSKPLNELIHKADRTRKKFIGEKMDLCSIVNAKSGLCSEDCKFCAQSSKHNTGVPSYPLLDNERILQSAITAKEIGAERFGIVTSGRSPTNKDLDRIACAINDIRKKTGIPVCASLGSLEKAPLKLLKDAGLSRYHHNIETSREYYKNIVSTHTFEERLKTIENVKTVGLEVCSGGILGMGEEWKDRLDMALTLKNMDVDSVPVNFLIPIKGTPFESLHGISPYDAIRAICMFRLLLKHQSIKIAAGRETILKDFQALGFLSGANGMLIGGYLTVKGRSVEEDHLLIKEIKKLWNG